MATFPEIAFQILPLITNKGRAGTEKKAKCMEYDEIKMDDEKPTKRPIICTVRKMILITEKLPKKGKENQELGEEKTQIERNRDNKSEPGE